MSSKHLQLCHKLCDDAMAQNHRRAVFFQKNTTEIRLFVPF